MRPFQIALIMMLSVPTGLIYLMGYIFNPSLLSLLTTLLFISIVVYAFTSLIHAIPNSLLRFLLPFLFFSVFATYLFLVFISYYLQGEYLNQRFFFHFRLSSITEAWMVARPLLALFSVWIISIWICLILWLRKAAGKEHSGSQPSKLILLAMLLFAPFLEVDIRTFALDSRNSLMADSPESLATVQWDSLELNRRALSNSVLEATPGKNLLLIYLEGLESLYMDDSVFPELTPNMDRFNAQGWQQHDMQQARGTEWTVGGLASSMCGTPLIYDSMLAGNDVMFSRILDQAVCLPDVLHNAGYQQVFMGGASTEFAGKGKFLAQHQFDQVLGRDQLLPMLEEGIEQNSWGLFDESLFDLAVQAFQRLADTGEPFNLTLLTVDTHHPVGVPSPGCPRYSDSDNSILQAVYCTDYLLGKFIQAIEEVPAFEETIVVLMSDHLAMRNDAFPLFPRDVERLQYFNVLNTESDMRNTPRVASTSMDVAPTVLDLLGVEHEVHFLAGSSLLDASISQRKEVLLHPLRSSTLGFLNSNYLTSAEGELFFELSEETFSELEIVNDIVDAQYRRGQFEFVSSGADPYFYLPDFPLEIEAGSIDILIELDAKQDTDLIFFYTTLEQPEFNGGNRIVRQIEQGKSTHYISLDARLNARKVRIDPGSYLGDYRVTRIEVRL